MKSYVITITDNAQSNSVADRCIKSANKFGIAVDKWNACTPRDVDFTKKVKQHQLKKENFETVFSRGDNALACFLSHLSLWEESVRTDQPVLILEHDAVFTENFPNDLKFDKVITLGKPSFGSFKTPRKRGVVTLTQFSCFKGAHAFVVSPTGATQILKRVSQDAKPTDKYLNKKLFPWLQEYYPWIAHVEDSFSTIQKPEGCKAKHTVKNGTSMKIIDA
jgi:GR25 family glycosyltransferase involved in LPS biosynthesis